MSEVTFHHCTLEHINFQFTGLNTKLALQNTAVSHCTTPNSDLPLFFMQTLYNFNATLSIKNSTFLHNKSPIIYAMQFEEIFMEDTLFLKNGKDIFSNMSMLTVSGSYVILKTSSFFNTLGTVVEVQNVKNFTVRKAIFIGNKGVSSCLLVKQHSNISFTDMIFKQNSNPVVFVRDNDGVNILIKVRFIPLYLLSLTYYIYLVYIVTFFIYLPLAHSFYFIPNLSIYFHTSIFIFFLPSSPMI